MCIILKKDAYKNPECDGHSWALSNFAKDNVYSVRILSTDKVFSVGNEIILGKTKKADYN
jgi:hypothetical protein